VAEARNHSILRAALSEYTLFARERQRQLETPAAELSATIA